MATSICRREGLHFQPVDQRDRKVRRRIRQLYRGRQKEGHDGEDTPCLFKLDGGHQVACRVGPLDWYPLTAHTPFDQIFFSRVGHFVGRSGIGDSIFFVITLYGTNWRAFVAATPRCARSSNQTKHLPPDRARRPWYARESGLIGSWL